MFSTMVAAPIPRHKPKARNPFAATLAIEFGVTKGHVCRVLTGERESPKRRQMLRRQRELLLAAKTKD